MADDYFGAASNNVKNQTADLLRAVATGGTEGLRQYEASTKAMGTSTNEAIGRAQQRSSLLGPGTASFESLPKDQGERRMADIEVGREGFHQSMANRGNAYHNYLSQVGAAIPLVKADHDKTLGQIAALAAKAEAEKAAAAEKDALENISLDSLLGMAQESQDIATEDIKKVGKTALLNAGGAVSNMIDRIAPFGKKATPERVIPAKPTTINGGVRMNPRTGAITMPTVTESPAKVIPAKPAKAPLPKLAKPTARVAPEVAHQPITDVAMAIGKTLGVPEAKLYALNSPAKRSSVKSAQDSLLPDVPKDTVAAAIVSKYGTKGIDLPAAQEILADGDFKKDVQWMLEGADGLTQDEALELLREEYLVENNKPRTFAVLIGEYLSRLPKE